MVLRFHSHRSTTTQAFSLAEVLIVIAVMGILAAVGMSFLGGSHRDTISRIRDQRNAQEIASLTSGALAVGVPVVEPGDMRGTIDNLMEGRQATTGAFSGRVFRLSPLSEEEIVGALHYLRWQGEQPVYVFGGD